MTVATITGVGSDAEESRTDERIDDLIGEVQTLGEHGEVTQTQGDRLTREVRRLQRRGSR